MRRRGVGPPGEAPGVPGVLGVCGDHGGGDVAPPGEPGVPGPVVPGVHPVAPFSLGVAPPEPGVPGVLLGVVGVDPGGAGLGGGVTRPTPGDPGPPTPPGEKVCGLAGVVALPASCCKLLERWNLRTALGGATSGMGTYEPGSASLVANPFTLTGRDCCFGGRAGPGLAPTAATAEPLPVALANPCALT